MPKLTDSDLKQLWARAEAHANAQQWDQAIGCFTRFAEARPDDPRPFVQLSYVESLAGRYRPARDYAVQASRLRPRDAETVKELVARLRTFNEAEAFKRYFAGLGPLSRLPIPLLLACAAQFSYLNLQGEAIRLLDEAKRGDPEYPATLLARGQVLLYLGRFEEARADIDRCLKRAPELAQGWWLLAQLPGSDGATRHVEQVRAQLQRPNRPELERVLLQMALHRMLDGLGDYEAAWQALEAACAARRRSLNYKPDESRALFAGLMAMPLAAPQPLASPVDRTPIFIVGMHRSGTTLLEQLLAASPEVRAVGELYDFTSAMRYGTDHHCKGVIDTTIVARAGAVDFPEVGRRYLEGMAWRLGEEPFFTDKLPSNFLNIGFICKALPQAKILHMVRDPMETCFSNLRELFSEANPYSYDQRELADYFIQYRRLMAHWQRAFPGRILDVDYARLTEDPAAVMREVAAFCGIEFIDAMTDTRSSTRAVATASAVQVRDGVRKRAVPKWVPYARHLQPLREALQAGGIEIGSAD
ncbi:sulfotransferase [Thermomonas sp.]|uniref:tetratricopeptide repeat-containing sulfotransferase family protein n=1 Tax=Thermomonas sp. TaxID=1971895 RepID=UPI0026022B24|nr:sulfotransferase [Thermomonas sp.]MCO5055666.1 sulfotransferase [Thermomonas sp.]